LPDCRIACRCWIFKLIIAYLLGLIVVAVCGSVACTVDIRTQGSGNAGGTNAAHAGWRFALGVVVIDNAAAAPAAWIGLAYRSTNIAAETLLCMHWPVRCARRLVMSGRFISSRRQGRSHRGRRFPRVIVAQAQPPAVVVAAADRRQ
jgi:hypothetical protein